MGDAETYERVIACEKAECSMTGINAGSSRNGIATSMSAATALWRASNPATTGIPSVATGAPRHASSRKGGHVTTLRQWLPAAMGKRRSLRRATAIKGVRLCIAARSTAPSAWTSAGTTPLSAATVLSNTTHNATTGIPSVATGAPRTVSSRKGGHAPVAESAPNSSASAKRSAAIGFRLAARSATTGIPSVATGAPRVASGSSNPQSRAFSLPPRAAHF